MTTRMVPVETVGTDLPPPTPLRPGSVDPRPAANKLTSISGNLAALISNKGAAEWSGRQGRDARVEAIASGLEAVATSRLEAIATSNQKPTLHGDLTSFDLVCNATFEQLVC